MSPIDVVDLIIFPTKGTHNCTCMFSGMEVHKAKGQEFQLYDCVLCVYIVCVCRHSLSHLEMLSCSKYGLHKQHSDRENDTLASCWLTKNSKFSLNQPSQTHSNKTKMQHYKASQPYPLM